MPTPTRLYTLTKRGAERQLRALLSEAKLLIELFPHLGDSFDKDELPLNFIMAKGSGALTKKARRQGPRLPDATRRAANARTRR